MSATEPAADRSIAEVAKAFTELLRRGDHEGAAARFNAPDIVSIEPMDGPMSRVQGTEAVKTKADWWTANNEVHGGSVDGPYLNGDQFAVHFTMDITTKATGERTTFSEVGLYTVRDGRIVEERFYY